MKPGTQIAYIPTHANGDINHPDVEYGFVTSERGNVHFCRYWSKKTTMLRTLSCSEATPTECLVLHDSKPKEVVDRLLLTLQP